MLRLQVMSIVYCFMRLYVHISRTYIQVGDGVTKRFWESRYSVSGNLESKL